MKHSIVVPQAKSFEELGVRLAQLRYDALIIVVAAMEKELLRQRAVDVQKRRNKLSAFGSLCLLHLSEFKNYLYFMLRVSKKYIEKDMSELPLLIDPDQPDDT